MRYSLPVTAVIITLALALSACGKQETKTGSLVQRFTMVDAAGVNFGLVELDPVNGGTIYDAQSRIVGRIVPPSPAAIAMAPLPEVAAVQ